MSDPIREADSLSFDAYAEDVNQTCSCSETFAEAVAILTLGLCGEAGEFAEIIKKHVGHGIELDPEHAADELGDVLWYLTAITTVLGIPLREIAERNIEKLRKRYPAGFIKGGGER